MADKFKRHQFSLNLEICWAMPQQGDHCQRQGYLFKINIKCLSLQEEISRNPKNLQVHFTISKTVNYTIKYNIWHF